jgi:glycosyltransferase involved in cell wall biosynthesis
VRVAHLHRIRGIGGSERHLLTLLPALRRLGIEAVMVGMDDDRGEIEPFYAALTESGVPYVRVPCPRDLDPLLARRLRRALGEREADVVHTHLVHADLYGALAASHRSLVSTKHNDDRFRAGPFRFVERLLARRAGAVIAITHSLERFCVEQVGIPEEKIEVVHYGLDEPPKAWGPNPEPPLPDEARLLLAVCRLERQKGLDVAVRALAGLPEDVRLCVLGEGPERSALERLASELGVAGRLLLPGRVGDVAALYRRATLVVHPVRWEGFGLALLEAMLCERAIVASAVSSIPEVVADGETGLLVPPDDPQALAAALTRLLEDEELRGRMGEAGLRRARAEFSVEKMARRTAEIYERLATRGSGRPASASAAS